MDVNKKGRFHIFVIILIIVLFISAFVLLFSGHYGATIVLFGILMALLSFISNWTGTDNEVYIYKKIHKNNNNW